MRVHSCSRTERALFTAPAQGGWRRYATSLLTAAVEAEGMGHADRGAAQHAPPQWLDRHAPSEPLYAALDAVLQRKRIPCVLKRTQIEAMQAAVAGRPPLTGAPLDDIDVDQIFLIEKQDKSYLPADRTWFQPKTW